MKKLLALAALALLAACSSEPPVEHLRLDYSQLGKIYLDTQDLRIIDRAKSVPQWSPYVGHKFEPRLTDAVNRWAADRLQAAGQMGHATFIIKDASVTEQSLATASDFESLFERQQASKYIGRIEVSLEAQAPVDGSVAIATANATHSVTLPEDPTEAEKYEAYNLLVTSLMTELDRNIDRAIREHMPRFLLSGPAVAAPSAAGSVFRPATEYAPIAPRGDSLMPPAAPAEEE